MASNSIREALTEEIALEGLDGITTDTLWIRLGERQNFTFSLDDSSKSYLWNCVLSLQGMEYFELSKPRPDLVPYNRFHYIDPETKHFLETEDVPDDIYPVKVIEEEGVLGSCFEYKTRKNITEKINSGKPLLAEVNKEYGKKLVIVASMKIRLTALIGKENDPDFFFDKLSYCILERIGRSRHNGEASFGTLSLQVFKESAKTLYYMLKKLRHLDILKKQRLLVVKKPANAKITCFLYQLKKYYRVVGNRANDELINLATYLSTKPDNMEEANRARADLKLYDMFKKVANYTCKSGERSFEFIDIPYTQRYPDAKPQEYLRKNNHTEKKIRMICLLKSVEELEQSLKREYDRESDEEDEEENVEPAVSVPHHQFKRIFDEPNLYQVMQLIKQAGSKGVSQTKLTTLTGVTRLAARRTLKFLLRMNYVTMVLENVGRQKTIMYVDAETVQHNDIHQSVQEEMKKFQKSLGETVPETPPTLKVPAEEPGNQDVKGKNSKSGKGKGKKEMPVISLNVEEPSEEKVSEIRQELGRIDEGKQQSCLTPMKLTPRQEIIQEIQQEGGVKVTIEETEVPEAKDRRSGEVVKGMKRFGYLLTESHVRRANWMLEVISVVKVIENFVLLRLLRNREREMNLGINMDQKSLKRLVAALTEEGRLRSFKAVFTMGERTRELTYLCAPSVTSSDEILLRMLEEAKLRYFSVSKEELKNRNLLKKAQNKVTPSTRKEVKIENIPKSALDTIRSHQERRKKLAEKLPTMKYDRKAGFRYGLLPKMLRFRSAHDYLFYLSHDMYGQPIKHVPKNDPDSGDIQKKTGSGTVTGAEVWKGEDRVDVAEGISEHIENEPPVYCDEMTWRRYLPPVPVHSGYPKGWILLSDCLMIMPVCLFCEVVNVCYNIEGLDEILKHPQKRFYPVINLPFTISQQLFHSKKYVHSFSTVCANLANMGLLSFGTEILKEKDQTFIYLHMNASLLDTRKSSKGYNKTRAPENQAFTLSTFHFEELSDLEPYWEYLRLMACNSNLGSKSMVHADLEDDISYEVKSLKQASAAYSPETVEDNGIIPGDQRGGAGLDSSLFCHTVKNWSYTGCQNPPRKYRKFSLSKGLKGGMDAEGKKEVVDSFNKLQLKGKDRLVLSGDPVKPVAIKKVTRENVKGNRGGKGIKRTTQTEITKTHKIISKMEGKIMKKRCIKLQKPLKKKKRAFEKGDDKDRDIYRERCKMRVNWSTKEDSVLLMCRLATLIMDNQKKVSLISYMKVRDYLHDKCGAISYDKTSQAVQRRIKFVLKNPLTETNFLLYYREAMQDEYVLRNYVSREFVLTDEDLELNFRKLVDYLLDKFKSLDLQKCSLPDNLDELRKNFTIQYIGKLQPHKLYHDVKNKADICKDVLRNILHSAVLLQDKKARTHEMFKLLSQYPDPLLSAVVKELRADGLFVIHKKNYQRESLSQLQTGMGLRNFKVSQRYLFQYKHSYLSAMFEESAAMWTELRDRHNHGGGEDEMLHLPFHPKSGECAMLFPMLLNRMLDIKITMPQELVIVDIEGFYKFPWGRGKNSSSQTKGDKMLQDLKVTQIAKEKQVGEDSADANEKEEASRSETENKEQNGLVIDTDLARGIEKKNGGQDTDIDTDLARGIEKKNGGQDADIDTDLTRGIEKKNGGQDTDIDTDMARGIEKKNDGQDTDIDTDMARGNEKKNGGQDTDIGTDIGEKNGEIKDAGVDKGSDEKVEKGKDADNESLGEDERGKGKDIGNESCEKGNGSKSEKVDANEEAGKSGRGGNTTNDIGQNNSVSLNEKTDKVDTDMPDGYTSVSTNHCTVIIPNLESSVEQATELLPGTVSGIASRTLLSLRRAEDCSFDDIRIFNAQDNFVVKSCGIEIKIRDNLAEGLAGNPLVKLVPGEQNEESNCSENKEPDISDNKKNKEKNDIENTETGKAEEMFRDDKMEKVSKMFIDKEKVKNIVEDLQKILPFKLNIEDVWKHLKGQGVPEDSLKLYQNVFNVIDGYGDLGVRVFDLKKHFEEGHPWKEAVNVLIHHSTVLKVGVTCSRYVSLNNARPWVIHAYKDIRGRGLHVDEDEDNTIPIDKNDRTVIHPAVQDPFPLLYTEPVQEANGKATDKSKTEKGQAQKGSSEDSPSQKKMRLEITEKEISDVKKDVKSRNSEKRLLNTEGSIEAETVAKRRKLDSTGNEGQTDIYHVEKVGKDIKEADSTMDSDKQIGPSTATSTVNDDKVEGYATEITDGDKETSNAEEKSEDGKQPGVNDPVNESDIGVGMQTRKLKKRKLPGNGEESTAEVAPALSTYDKVRLVIQPWRKPEGYINKPILKMMMESVLLYLMMNPGSPEEALVSRYTPYLQPMILRNIVDILEDIGCLTKQYVKKRKMTLFSKPALPEIGVEEEEDTIVLMVPTEDCIIKMGLFGQEVFPNAKWPENTYPQRTLHRL